MKTVERERENKTVKNKIYKFALVMLASGMSSSALASVILPPDSGIFRNVASNNGSNVWWGSAQSFIAPAQNIVLGAWIASYAAGDIRLALLSGDGPYGVELQSQVVPVTVASLLAPTLVTANFSDQTLVIGNSYTLRVSLSDRSLPSTGSVSSMLIGFHSTSNAYTGGRFYHVGGSLDFQFPNRDMAIYAVSSETSAAVPEPASWAMLITGFGLVGGSLRRRSKAFA